MAWCVMRSLLCSCMAAWWLHTTHNKQHTTHNGGCCYGLWSRPHDYTHHIGDVAGSAMCTALCNCQCSLLMVELADSNSRFLSRRLAVAPRRHRVASPPSRRLATAALPAAALATATSPRSPPRRLAHLDVAAMLSPPRCRGTVMRGRAWAAWLTYHRVASPPRRFPPQRSSPQRRRAHSRDTSPTVTSPHSSNGFFERAIAAVV